MVFLMVVSAIGLKSFQQRVMMTDRYPLMGAIAGVIYFFEVSAVVVVAAIDKTHIYAGMVGAMVGVPLGVYLYTHVFIKKKKEVHHEQLCDKRDSG